MSKQSSRPSKLPTISWKTVVLLIAAMWLFCGLIVGERIKADELEFTAPGCSVRGKKLERETKGLPLEPLLSNPPPVTRHPPPGPRMVNKKPVGVVPKNDAKLSVALSKRKRE